MSTLGIDNIQPALGGTAFSAVDGVAKALLHYDQTAPSVDASVNVSSVTDSGSGDFTTNFTNPFSNANYVPSVDLGNAIVTTTSANARTVSPTSGALRVLATGNNANNDTAADYVDNAVKIHGSLL